MPMLFSLALALTGGELLQTPDTLRIEVGSPLVDGSIYKPHRARVRVHLNSLDTSPTVSSLVHSATTGVEVLSRWTRTRAL